MIRIRSFRPADYNEVRRLWLSTEGIGLNESDTRAAVGRFLKRNPGFSVVAVAEKRIVGAMLCGHDGRRGYLHHLAVARKQRRQGIGRELVEVCLGKLRAVGIPKCNLFLFTSNRPGRIFWRHLGWTVRSDLSLVQRATVSKAPICGSSC